MGNGLGVIPGLVPGSAIRERRSKPRQWIPVTSTGMTENDTF